MTNEDKLREIFPKTIFVQHKENEKITALVCSDEWLNAEYQEPTTKSDLGVDAVSRQEVLYLIADYDLSMGQVVKGIHALPSVTPQEPRWIPVSERLPDTDDEVLCWYEYYHWSQEKVLPEYGLGCYFKETKSWFGEVANGKDVRVIAWMPLPEPFEPQESEEENGKKKV